MNTQDHRQEPSEGSEQLIQLLFGEVCEVLDRQPRWTKSALHSRDKKVGGFQIAQ